MTDPKRTADATVTRPAEPPAGQPVSGPAFPPPSFDATVPHSARVWNYWLEGKDHYPVDRDFGEKVHTIYPGIVADVRVLQAFRARAVGFLAGEVGIRQFLDIGVGLPQRAGNTHQVAQEVDPTCRVVYVDNDPLVLVFSRALLASSPEGATAYLEADVHEPEEILAGAAGTLDLSRPVALVLTCVLGHIGGTGYGTVDRLVAALAPGSFLVVADLTADTGEAGGELRDLFAEGLGYAVRTPEQLAGFLAGLELLEPGVVPVARWRPDPLAPDPPAVGARGGVARTGGGHV